MNICLQCSNKTDNPKFCSLSCSGKYQKGRRPNLVNRDKICITCGIEFVAKADRKQKFCSRSCSASFHNFSRAKQQKTSICKWCLKEIVGAKKTYCNNKCQMEFQTDKIIKDWIDNPSSGQAVGGVKKSIKMYLVQLSGNKCSMCGWNKVNPVTNKVPLEIDHINGDSLDNRPENLRVLCPNCHALTPTYRALNKNSSRLYRKKYYTPKHSSDS